MSYLSEQGSIETRTEVRDWVVGHPLVAYFLLAYVFGWGIGIPLALKAGGVIEADIPFSLHYLISYAPMTAAVIVTWVTDGRGGVRELFGRVLRWRVKPFWWGAALSPVLLLALGIVVLRLSDGVWMPPGELGHVSFMPHLGLIGTMVLWIMTFGLGEETGWRGFALPRLQSGRGAIKATLILWSLWAFWHLPMFFYLFPTSFVHDPVSIIGFLIGMLTGAIILTWLYNGSGGSILMVLLWHGIYNLATSCTVCKSGPIAAVVTTGVVMVAVGILIQHRVARSAGKQAIARTS